MRNNKGFSLVELIVVIAIMAILASVAVIGVSVYVPKAQKQADQTLVNDIANALEMYYYSNPTGNENMVTSVALTQNGATASDEFSRNAMIAAFGNDWQNKAKLAYDEWGNGAAVAQTVIANFTQAVNNNDPLGAIYNGSAKPSYADDVDDLFIVLKDTSIEVGEAMGESGAQLVQGAANITMTADITAEEFAQKWATAAWDSDFLMGGQGVYSGDTSTMSQEALQNAIANAAVIKARNTSMAIYLQSLGYSSGVYSVFFNHNYGGSAVPKDAYATLEAGNAETEAFVAELMGTGLDFDDVMEIGTALEGYFANGQPSGQAYIDGLAYYAMMSTVNNVDNTNIDDNTYWDNMSSAVSLYGSIASGEISLGELQSMYDDLGSVSDNSVVITLMVKNGELTTQVSPNPADPQKNS